MEGAKKNWVNISGEGSEIYMENLKKEIESRFNDGTLKEWVDNKMPGWIVSEHTSYCKELENMSNNWGAVCANLKIGKKGILRVKNAGVVSPEDKNMTMLQGVCEFLTRMGYAVKHYLHFAPCPSCGYVILGKDVQETLWGKGNYYKQCKECINLEK
jgi:hypothetical protein